MYFLFKNEGDEKWWKLFTQMLIHNDYLKETRMEKFGATLSLTTKASEWINDPNTT